MSNIFHLCKLRAFLLLRQKMGLLSFLMGGAIVVLSYLFAEASFIRPQKIFWDFSLGGFFLGQVILSIYLGTQLVSEEGNRRTLHLVLCAGVSRSQWLIGNVLGLTLVLAVMNIAWTSLAFLANYFLFGDLLDLQGPWLIIQNQLFLSLSAALILLLGMFFSVLLRPLLALFATSSLVLLIYSTDSIRRIFLDPESGRFVESRGIHWILWITKIFPPLNWLNLKDMVSYESSISSETFLVLVGSSLCWLVLLALGSVYVFDRKDL